MLERTEATPAPKSTAGPGRITDKEGDSCPEQSSTQPATEEPAPPDQPPPPPPAGLSVCPEELAPDIAESIQQLECLLGARAFFLIDGDGARSFYDQRLENRIALSMARDIDGGRRCCVVLDSLGGLARPAFKFARVLQRRCPQGYETIVPQLAKSAATLFALGSKRILLGELGELGPLDAQIFDEDSEDYYSALDEVHALQKIFSSALTALDSTMVLLHTRARHKKTRSLLPLAMDFVAKTTSPMFASLDVVHFNRMTRALNVTRAYGQRLLSENLPELAEGIAKKLVEDYPEHEFVIDLDEAVEIGLPAEKTPEEVDSICRALISAETALIGTLQIGGRDG